MANREYHFWVYIVASRSRQLYIGMTNSLQRRTSEHKERRAGAYAARYNIDRLVYFQHFNHFKFARAREDELKDWNRSKKLALINSFNPAWVDLSETLFDRRGEANLIPNGLGPQTADSFAALRNDSQEDKEERKR